MLSPQPVVTAVAVTMLMLSFATPVASKAEQVPMLNATGAQNTIAAGTKQVP